jgi:hypothetical protein
MKRFGVVVIVVASMSFAGCSKKEDAPKPYTPHVAGSWSGNGTDDAIGYFTIGVDMAQSGDSASGTFTMNSAIGSVKGDFMVGIDPQGTAGGKNLRSMTMTRRTWNIPDPANQNRVCAATLSLVRGTGMMTSSATEFHYTMTDCQGGTWVGGANMRKDVASN